MKKNQWFIIVALFVIGAFWIFFLQSLVFENLFEGLLAIPGGTLSVFIGESVNPAFQLFWYGSVSALLVWYVSTLSTNSCSSKQARKMQNRWWIAAAVLILWGFYSLFWFIHLSWQWRRLSPIDGGPNYYELSSSGWLFLISFVVLDCVLLFWLPTLLASPRNYRLVVPGAVKILGSRLS
jgi:hypothetical protein